MQVTDMLSRSCLPLNPLSASFFIVWNSVHIITWKKYKTSEVLRLICVVVVSTCNKLEKYLSLGLIMCIVSEAPVLLLITHCCFTFVLQPSFIKYLGHSHTSTSCLPPRDDTHAHTHTRTPQHTHAHTKISSEAV